VKEQDYGSYLCRAQKKDLCKRLEKSPPTFFKQVQSPNGYNIYIKHVSHLFQVHGKKPLTMITSCHGLASHNQGNRQVFATIATATIKGHLARNLKNLRTAKPKQPKEKAVELIGNMDKRWTLI
jgi:hypothetical protein